MGNCLVTKLNVSVNNPGLEKFGVLTIHNPSSDDTYTSRTFFIIGIISSSGTFMGIGNRSPLAISSRELDISSIRKS